MKKNDCTFIYLNVLNGYLTGAEYEINSAYLRCYLSKYGIRTIQYIAGFSTNYNAYVSELKQLKTKRYAFYISEYNYYITKVVINCLKKENPESLIYILGPSSKYIAQHLYNEIYFDISFIRHAYHAMLELLSEKKENSQVHNIFYRNKYEVVSTGEYEYEYSLDDLGLPYSEGFIPVEEIVHVGMLTSEGCYGNCIFCSYKTKHCNYIIHEIDSILKELDYISAYACGKEIDVRFLDDCFSISKERTLILLNEMLKRKYRFRFWCCVRADILTDEILDYMSLLNFKEVVIGLESSSPEILDTIQKAQSPYTANTYISLIKEKFLKAREKNISPILSINFGLPYETENDAFQTVDFINEINGQNDVSVSFMTCFPGSKIFTRSDEYKVMKEESPVKLPFRTYYKVYSMKKIFDLLYDNNIHRNHIAQYTKEIMSRYLELFTGMYPMADFKPAINTIFVDKIDENNLQYIDKHIEINGTVIQNADQLTASNDFYSDNRKQIKIRMQLFDYALMMAYEQNSYLPNQDYIKISNKHVFIQHNNEYLKNIIKISMKKLIHLDELKEITSEAQAFHEKHSINMIELERFNLYNICRFAGVCRLNELRSIRISKEEVCTGCTGDKLGTIRDDYSTLLKKINNRRNEVYKARNCDVCGMKRWCPKCLFLEDFHIQYQEYCNFILNNKDTIIYLKIIYYVKNSLLKYNVLEDSLFYAYLPTEEIYLSSNYEEFKINDEICLVEQAGDTYLLYLLESNFRKCEFEEGRLIKSIVTGMLNDSKKRCVDKLLHKFIEYGVLKRLKQKNSLEV